MVEVVPLTKFGDPSSNRLVTIHNGTDGQTGRAKVKSSMLQPLDDVVGYWKWRILKECPRFPISDSTFSSTNAMFARYMAIFKIPHFTISYFRILTTLILVCHTTSKAVSRPIRITKHRRRTTNRSRDMLDFRILAFRILTFCKGGFGGFEYGFLFVFNSNYSSI